MKTTRLFQVVKYARTAKLGSVSQHFFDAEQLIVFCYAIGAGGRTRFNLSGIGGYGDICNGCIFSFTGTVRDYCRVAGPFGHLNSVEGFG